MIKAIFRNWPAKIICLVMAVSLWVYVGTGQARIGDFPGNIPLEIQDVPQGLVAVTDVDKITIKIVAGADVWKSLGAGSFKANVNLTGLHEGTFDVPVNVTTNVTNVQIVEVKPSKILVRLEKVSKKEVPVNLLVEGKPADGFVVGDWKVRPDRVEVSGASSVVGQILEATAKISLSGEKTGFRKTARLVALDANGKEIENINFNPREVEVDVPIVQASSAKTVGIKVNTIGQVADGFWISSIETDPTSVAVIASASIASNVSFVETKDVDVTGLNKNFETTTTLKPNPNIVVMDKVDSIRVKISISSTGSTKQVKAGFNWQKLPSNLVVSSVDPANVTVALSGSVKDLASVGSGSVIINVDLSRISSPGTFSIDLTRDNVELPSNIAFSSMVPSAINVTVIRR